MMWAYYVLLVMAALMGILWTYVCWQVYKRGGPYRRRMIRPPPTFEEWRIKRDLDISNTITARHRRVSSGLLCSLESGRTGTACVCSVCRSRFSNVCPRCEGLAALSEMG